MMRGLLHLYPSGTMIGAAPRRGLVCGGTVTKNSKKTLCPPCLGKALRRGPSYLGRFSGFWHELNRFMSVSPEQKYFHDPGMVFCRYFIS